MGSLLVLRLGVAAVFIYHSVFKLKDARAMAGAMGWTPGQVLALGLVEFVSAMGIAGGVGIKFSAFLLMTVMFGAIYHKIFVWKVPFMAHDKTGWEFDFILSAALLTIFLKY